MKNSIRLLLIVVFASSLYGQTSLDTTAGGDQTYNSYGLQTAYKWHQLSGWMGVGYSDGIKFGGFLRVPLTLRKYVAIGEMNETYHVALGIGDQRLPALLDTDEYDSHGFSVRGVSLLRKSKTSSLTVFSGLLSQERALTYMHTSYTSGKTLQTTPLGAMVYEHQVSKTLRFHSLNLMGTKLTSIASLGWNPSKMWRFAGATGIGSGAKYLAGSGEFHQKRIDLRTSYTLAGKDFQRQEQPYYSTELTGLNARVTVTPITALQLSFNHEHSRTNITGLPSVEGTFNTANLAATVLGFHINPSVSTFNVSNSSERTITETISGSKQILPRWQTFGAYIHSESPSFKQQTIVATNEFRVSPRLAIRQDFNRIDGQNNFSFGGDWVSNFISISVDNQVYVSPIASAFGGKSVFQAWTFSIRMRAPHGTTANINTMVDPNGQMRWGGYLSGLRYDSIAPQRSTTPLFSKYIIRGKVLDEVGNGVWGIAVKVGQELVVTDEAGEFYLDVKNTKPMPVAVAKESSLQVAYWHLTSAPATARGQLEAAPGEPLHITVSTNPARASL